VPTPEAERLFLESFTKTRERSLESLNASRTSQWHLPNTDFDTGQPTVRGEYSLADTTYDELLDKLAHRAFTDLPRALAVNIVAYYGAGDPLPGHVSEQQERSLKIRRQLASLKTACVCP
jgi:hypothetical protein